jgi:spore coat protein U-like protein
MKFRFIVPVLLAVLPWAEAGAQAKEAQTTFRVTARVDAVCGVTVADLDFGAYTGAAAPVQVSTNLTMTCTPQTLYQIGFNEGTSPGSQINDRKLAAGGTTLNYQLYRDASHLQIWGNTSGTDTVGGTASGLEQVIPVYGQIPGSQLAPAGAYSDTITVRIYY